MTNTRAASSPLPLFYGAPILLRFPEHGGLGVRREGHYAFASGAIAVPLTLREFAAAGRHMPIVFAQDEDALPLAVTGLTADRNVFVTGENGWRPGCYVPAYLRRYPFIAVQETADSPPSLGIDSMSALVVPIADWEGVDRLFDEAGAPTPRTQAAMALCHAYASEHEETRHFTAALKAHRLLVPRTVQLRGEAPGKSASNAEPSPVIIATLTGFQVVDEAAFQALPAEVVADFHTRGWLATIVLHLASQLSWEAIHDTESAARR